MRSGDTLRFRGPAGAPFVLTVGEAFTPEFIETKVGAGEWTPTEEQKPEEPKHTPRKRSPRKN